MNDDVARVVLNGMPLTDFIAFYGIAVFVSLIMFIMKIHRGIKVDAKTPNKFSWRHFFKGFTKLLVTLMAIAPAIIFFKDLSPFVLNLGLLGDVPEGVDIEIVADVNAFTAFLIGFGIDRVLNTVSEKYLKKK